MGLPPKDYVDPNSGLSPVTPHGEPQGRIGSDGRQLRVGPQGTLKQSVTGHGREPGQTHSGAFIPDRLSPMAIFASSSLFQNFTLAVIVANGIWIGIDVQWNHPAMKKDGKTPLEPMSIVVENAFCVYFTFEIVVRVIAFGKKNFTNGWFIFDFVLVLFMVIETWIMAIVEAIVGGGGGGILSKFSCLRLLRLTRLTRIMTSLPELLMLVKGMIKAARSVGIMLLFIVLLMYIFAIVLTANLSDFTAKEHRLDPYWVRGTDPTSIELFGSMGDSMMSLFTRGLLGDNLAETLEAIKDRAGPCEEADDVDECTRVGGEENLWLMWVFILFMVISSFCLLNMLVGVLCEVITNTAAEEGEANQIIQLRRNIEMAFYAIDQNDRECDEGIGDDQITKAEWSKMRQKDAVRKSFEKIGVVEEFMDEQLDQIEEQLFGRLDKNKMLDSINGWMPDPCESEKDEVHGIPMDEFVQKVLDIRPAADAGHLDLYVLQTRVERDEIVFCKQLERIEDIVTRKKIGDQSLPLSLVLREPSKNSNKSTGVLDTATSVEATQKDLDKVTMERNSSPVEIFQTEEPNNGTSLAFDPWLSGLSTEVLFAELKHRAAQQQQTNSPLPPAMELS